MEQQLEVPEGMFRVYMLDPSRGGEWPGEAFSFESQAVAFAQRLNEGRDYRYEPYHVVKASTGTIVYTPSLDDVSL